MITTRRLVFFLLIFLAAPLADPALPAPQKAAAAASQSAIEHGRYLVEEVAKCTECHTPRDDNGQLIKARWLQGAPVWIMPTHPTTNWAMRAPALAGFPGFTEEQGEVILEKGTAPDGRAIQPPMHIYHMNHEDAVAIIAYLRSLPTSPE